ncbi:coatomer subunit zeta-1 isoform X3 [Pogoniulus pusillus]|uniref:coatomer subunit zeta-1 isoform X3 n=1 Tax=Pogoniulus pusillus TaxID=488313 RepID=UPI0030B9657F
MSGGCSSGSTSAAARAKWRPWCWSLPSTLSKLSSSWTTTARGSLPSTTMRPTPVPRSREPSRRTSSARLTAATLMLTAVLSCLFDSLSQMLRKSVEKRGLLENMEGLFLAVDEIVDGGVILESDPQQVVHRVAVRGEDVPLTEQTVSQVLQSAKEQIKWTLLR